jgi:Flp pilus assembly pilin Flp
LTLFSFFPKLLRFLTEKSTCATPGQGGFLRGEVRRAALNQIGANGTGCTLFKGPFQGGMMHKNNAKGVTIVEYAIMLALIAIAIAVAGPTSAVVGVLRVFSQASSVLNK